MALLPNLQIENYRLFRSFGFEHLAPITLIAGQNNTGKSTLLEAAYLAGTQDPRNALVNILSERGEITRREMRGSFAALFSDYFLIPEIAIEIRSGQNWFKVRLPDEQEWERLARRFLRIDDEAGHDKGMDSSRESLSFLLVETASSGTLELLLRDNLMNLRRPLLNSNSMLDRVFFIRGTDSIYRRYREISTWWDAITLTPQKELVLQALRIVDEQVLDIDFLSLQENVKVRLHDVSAPVYLGSLGDGMRHLLAVALALTQAKDGLLLLDEIETGLHFLTQVKLWQMLFKTALDFNVQIMATTHSSDCIAAFSRVWAENDESLGQYIRLDAVDKRILPEFYTSDGLARAVAEGIETR